MSSRSLFAVVWTAAAVFLCVVLAGPVTRGQPPGGATEALAPPVLARPTAPTGAPASSPGATSARPPPRRVAAVSHLLRPEREYLGIAVDDAHREPRLIEEFARHVGTRPNLITVYQSFGDDFAARDIRRIHRDGALPLIRWEPFRPALSDIAAGRSDRYLTAYARAVRRTNVPLAMTFAHEMNGFWYPWDARHATSEDYKAAWHRIHDVFRAEGATNVIWSWAPNVISGGPGVELEDWYPGDAFVDWIGIDGYFAKGGPATYESLFGPTIREIKGFTDRPYLIVETGVEAGWSERDRALASLFRGVADDDRMIGFVYFNQRGSHQWQLTGDPTALAVYARSARRLHFGFTVR